MAEHRKNHRIRFIWAVFFAWVPCCYQPPFIYTNAVKHVALDTQVSFDYTNGLLSIASLLFGFSLLIIISEEWVEELAWAVLLPPLALTMVLSDQSAI